MRINGVLGAVQTPDRQAQGQSITLAASGMVGPPLSGIFRRDGANLFILFFVHDVQALALRLARGLRPRKNRDADGERR